MTILFETPVPVLLVGLLTAALLAVLYLNTRQRGLLIALAAVAALTAGGVALERWVQTDREQISDLLDQLAAALRADGLEANTPELVIPAVYECISPSAERTRLLARTNLNLVEILSAKHSSLRVQVNRLTSPPTAEARFDAQVTGRGRGYLAEMVAERMYPLEFVVEMRQENGRWLIGDDLRWQLKTFGDAEPDRFGFDTGR